MSFSSSLGCELGSGYLHRLPFSISSSSSSSKGQETLLASSRLSGSPHLSPAPPYASEHPLSPSSSSVRRDRATERPEEGSREAKSKRENGSVATRQQEEEEEGGRSAKSSTAALHPEKDREEEHANDRDDERKKREKKKAETGGYEDEEENNLKGREEKKTGDNNNNNISTVKMNGEAKSSRAQPSLANYSYCKSHEFVDDVRTGTPAARQQRKERKEERKFA